MARFVPEDSLSNMLTKYFLFALALLFALAPVTNAQENDNAEMWIDSPDQGTKVGQTVDVSGWAFDRTAGTNAGPGVDLVRAYAGLECEGEILAETSEFTSRADVLSAYGLDASYTNSGFRLTIENVPEGTFTFIVCVRSSVTHEVETQRIRTVTTFDEVPTRTWLDLDFPKDHAYLRQVWLHGWAIDTVAGNGNGPGVDLVRMYKGDSCAGEVLGEDTNLPWYPNNVGRSFDYLDESYHNRTYTIALLDPKPGNLTFTVCARSAVTGEFEASITRTIHVYSISWKRILALIVAIASIPVIVYKLGLLTRTFAMFFVAAELTMGIFWVAFYPGVMTLDGYFQWLQLLGHIPLENSHPYPQTLWMEALNLGTEYFAITSFVQMMLSATLFAGLATWLLRQGVQRWIVIAGYIILLLLPSTGFYSITMWKDITAAQFMLAFTVGWLMITIDGVKLNLWGVIGMGLFAGVTFMLGVSRHNHLPLLLIVPVMLWILTQIRWQLKLVYTTMLVFLVIAMIIPLQTNRVISTQVSTPEGVVSNTLDGALKGQLDGVITRYLRSMSIILYDSKLLYSDSYRDYVPIDPIVPGLRGPLTRLMSWSAKAPVRYIFWNHVPALLMVFAMGFVGLWRRNRSLIGLFLVYGALLGTVFILSQRFQNWRYVYFLNYFEFFSIPILLVCWQHSAPTTEMDEEPTALRSGEAAQ